MALDDETGRDSVTRVSVLIPCFNAELWIAAAIESALEQGRPGIELEIIVADDASTDRSREVIARFPAVRLVRATGGNASAARNRAFAASSGEYIQFLDADDLLAPGKIEQQLGALERSAGDIAYGQWRELHSSSAGERLGELVDRELGDEPDADLLGDSWSPPAAYLFRRQIVEKVGGWNTGLQVIEDVRFVVDCALISGRFVKTGGVAALYRIHSDASLSRRDRREFSACVLKNVREIVAIYRERGILSSTRRTVALRAYSFVARAAFRRWPELFESATTEINALDGRGSYYGPLHFQLLSRLVGFRAGEAIASRFRSIARRRGQHSQRS